MKKFSFCLTLAAVAAGATIMLTDTPAEAGRGNGPVIYVRSQGLYFDSIVTADPLPRRGSFQQLEMVSGQLETDFGPGDSAYRGGRWWLDTNGDGLMDDDDHYFSCPLLPPGRENP